MTRPLMPPDGKAYLSSVVMFELGLSSTIRDTYAALRVLAWGRAETPELTKADLERYTGKDFQTLYRQLPVLTLNGVLRVRHVSTGLYSVVFTDGISGANNCLKNETSRKRESPIKDSFRTKGSESKKNPEVKEDSEILKNETSRKRESPESWSEKGRELARAYVGWVGYEPPKADPVEIEAVEWLATHFTVEQVQAVYDELKATEFWAKKPLGMKYLRKAVPEHYNALERKAKNANANHRPNQNRPSQSETKPTGGGIFNRVKRN